MPEWTRPGDPRGEITIDDLLHMNSGLYTEAAGDPQMELYFGGASAAERAALNIVDSKPATRFVYAGSDTILAIRALRAAARSSGFTVLSKGCPKAATQRTARADNT